jgi:glycosyltransferase involved in cell wall biosynthesis
VIEENRCGFTVDSQRSDSLVNHIITLAQDEDVYEQMSMNAADLGKKYDRSLLSQQYIELLTEVTGHES